MKLNRAKQLSDFYEAKYKACQEELDHSQSQASTHLSLLHSKEQELER